MIVVLGRFQRHPTTTDDSRPRKRLTPPPREGGPSLSQPSGPFLTRLHSSRPRSQKPGRTAKGLQEERAREVPLRLAPAIDATEPAFAAVGGALA